MHASTYALVAAYGHPGTAIQMDTEADGLHEDPEWCVLFAMDASTDGLVVAHRHCYNLCLFTMDASTERLVVAHGQCGYDICTRLAVEAAVITINELCYICVCDARRTDS